ncbi:CPBP family intramembrane glutamic endopeptidase [Kordiimonas laminariae]|uniref:CPBP family intramembrane glutamic endopeptidase n=1 Tax=Kordiimonas laminariae TaxID=2917717 RepID=UPI001FF48B37|nr:CPBP family intramembrane glutamic endopeptidase [Kordiimonas laminariae]MCK0070876.1 CPBP family intramembrane metalloprotease [Kordiimonas laminariae]
MTASTQTNQQIWTALRDCIFIIGTLLVVKSLLLEIEPLWSYAGPISLLFTLGIATWCLKQSNVSWSLNGNDEVISWKRLATLTVIALVVTIAVGILAQSLAVSFIGTPSEAIQAIDERFQGRFANLPGNFPVYLFWLITAWVIGGLTEEILFRKILFVRFEMLFSKIPATTFLAISAQAMLFGQQHYYYQGAAGWVATGVIGFISGLLYLVFKRNLWPLILSHGISNSIGLTLLYFGVTG